MIIEAVEHCIAYILTTELVKGILYIITILPVAKIIVKRAVKIIIFFLNQPNLILWRIANSAVFTVSFII